jgi:ribosome-associated protein
MDDLQVGGLTIPAAALSEVFETSGGPGGQHANRNETAVRLRLDMTKASLPKPITEQLVARLGETVEVVATDSRSQWRNRAIARRRLREKLEMAMVDPPPRRRTRPTHASHRRRLDEKRARGEKKRLRRRPEVDE